MNRRIVCLDYETERIQDRPHYPPTPVGVAILDGDSCEYHAWGHPVQNNCTPAFGQKLVQDLLHDPEVEILCHNAAFDLAVACEKMHCEMPHWSRIHDTMYLLFLLDPYSKSLALKPSADRYLGMPPEERDAVRDWLMANQQELRDAGLLPSDVTLTDAKKGKPSPSGYPRNWGAWICLAPGELVGRYAKGDVLRTMKLFDFLLPQIQELGMMDAYNTERQLLPILLRNEREGLLVDIEALDHDIPICEESLERAINWLRERLGCPDLEVSKDQQVCDALEAAGQVDPASWVYTDPTKTNPKGLRSIGSDNIKPSMFQDPRIYSTLLYISRMEFILKTFMKPWLRQALETGGTIHTRWNQVRSDGGGAATGRMSCSPPLMNISKSFEGREDGYEHPAWCEASPLPLARKYILPDDGCVFGHADFDSQEVRLAAHFADGEMLTGFHEHPLFDAHQVLCDATNARYNAGVTRSQAKAINFGVLYGQGVKSLAKRLDIPEDLAQRIKQTQREVLSGLAGLEQDVKRRAKRDEPVRTWGGRVYHKEKVWTKDGRYIEFDYKLLNYLIQGSAADCTKRAIIAYDAMRKHGRFMVTVHDEINISVPQEHLEEELAILDAAMRSVNTCENPIDTPMRTSAKAGPNWGSIKKLEKK